MPRLIVCCLAVLVIAGCSKSVGPETVAVTGTVTLDGTPVEGAVVVFTPATQTTSSQQAAQGETDSVGKYEIQTYVSETSTYKSGITPGSYVITVTKLELPTDMRGQPKHVLPKKYRNTATTPLKADVSVGVPAVFDFELVQK